ncbi:aminoacyl-tRNA hydrolase [Alkalibacter saccharofermentans]|uniref:Peptidyl-tRNA hydrolase n=1 Tax=Alkalibacter saccharofermentans DSM 14828 TaxID=1120975 RepID=A0A1M4YD42_9FIRM|nr:aminoacyl-tRNA hydrolase [Alkalibacter saccharofermentans]SHF03426.1 peptidyl-tRNA hydrolase [Alkalibacter saccharofermentans DSM 14828]
MKVIIGLGNPERKYDLTRHNIGFELIDYLGDKHKVSFKSKHRALMGEFRHAGEKVLLVKPQTYMNLSGECVKEIMDYYGLDTEDLLVAYDDIDLEPGKIRLRPKGSAGTHNGMRSIINHVQSDDIPRLRIGIGKPEFGDLAAYVLGRFSGEEKELMKKAVVEAAKAVESYVEKDVHAAMNLYNR